jgi:serine/threonine-protein kinase
MIEPGTMLDRYECLHPIGKGGMASVWAARLVGKHGFEKLVAIKTMLPEHARDPEFLKMLLDEAHILSGIRTPNVASVLDLGEQDGLFYLVFEWVDGEQLSNLRRALKAKRKTMPLGVALRIVSDTCTGLHAAHEVCDAQGWPLCIVHRDVSPQNIMLTASGDVKIIDFGIAKALDRVAGDTISGKIKGKTLYMAPEQVRGEDIDRRIDIWATGVILHQLVTNRVHLRAENDFELLQMLASNREPSPVPATVPPEVAKIITRALRPQREERYPTAGEMQRDLERAMVAVAGAVTAADVATFAQQHVGDLIEAKRTAIADALESATHRSQAGKHQAARSALASLSGAETEPISDAAKVVAEGVQDARAMEKSFTSLRPVDGGHGVIPDGTPTTAGPSRGRMAALVVGGILAATLVGFSSVYVARGSGPDVPPALPLSLAPLRATGDALAERATASQVMPSPAAPASSEASPGAASAPAPPASATTAKPKPRPVSHQKPKDPLSVFGTR